uniref:Uncharacterized protein n=1 Tax=Anguilla anguilla TaxID=7936 RepID=A0A0E9S8S8_ANGAN
MTVEYYFSLLHNIIFCLTDI